MDKFHKRLETGDVLFRQGEPGACAYVVEQGALEVWTGDGAERRVLARVGPQALIGEMALISRQPRMASVTALEPTVVCMITREHLSERLASSDPLLRHLLQVILGRYRDLLERLDGDFPLTVSDFTEHPPGTPVTAAGDQDQAMRRMRTEQALEVALEQNELRLFYQPIVRLGEGGVAGFEGLVRWEKPGEGLISPAAFIPVLEESQLIARIGHWIFEQGCADLVRLQRANGGTPLTLSLNLSPRQFLDEALLDQLAAALQAHSIPPHQLRLEITESLLLDNWEWAVDLLNRARAMGVRLAMDDFGTGYSSLAYLHRFPVDTLKLDQAFVREMGGHEDSRRIVRAIAALARELDKDFIVEGVETAEQAQALHRLQVEYGQGYLFGRPMPLKEAEAYLAAPPSPVTGVAC